MFSTAFTSFVFILYLLLFLYFDSVSCNIDEVLSIMLIFSESCYHLSVYPSANVFVFGDFNVHHKDWLTYSGGTDGPGELFLNNFTQMVKFSTRIPDCDSHSPALFNFFLLTQVFVLQWLSIHWEIHIIFLSQFPLTFHQIYIRMSHFIALLLTRAD